MKIPKTRQSAHHQPLPQQGHCHSKAWRPVPQNLVVADGTPLCFFTGQGAEVLAVLSYGKERPGDDGNALRAHPLGFLVSHQNRAVAQVNGLYVSSTARCKDFLGKHTVIRRPLFDGMRPAGVLLCPISPVFSREFPLLMKVKTNHSQDTDIPKTPFFNRSWVAT